jgi:peptidoglycan/LPS O-acetylase OafA/YrhL
MDLFFILSGFLIGTILFRTRERHGTQQVGRFYLRRIFRTFPPYYLVLTVLALWQTLTPDQVRSLPYEYAYLTNFRSGATYDLVMGWGWSLALEEQFYLVAPLLVWGLLRLRTDRARIAVLVGACVLALVIRLAIWASRDVFGDSPWGSVEFTRAVYFRTYTRFDTLVCGVLLALVELRYGARIGRWLEHPFHRALLAVPAMTLLWLLLSTSSPGAGGSTLSRTFYWGTATCLMYVPVLLLLLHVPSATGRFLALPLFRWLATLGYGVYLIHIPVIEVLAVHQDALAPLGLSPTSLWLVSLVIAMLVSLAIGYLLHLLVEKPSLWLRDRVAG